MRKVWKKLACVSCAAVAALSTLGLAACGEEKVVINAYDIAVANGFVGTEKEWLQSLHGANGEDGEDLDIYDIYEAAKLPENGGFTGTFVEFLRQYLEVNMQEDNDTATIAKNMSSVVGVYCAFEKTTTYRLNSWPFTTQTKTTVAASAGSGVVVELNKQAGNAYIITNYHVLYQTSKYTDSKNGISDCIYVYPYGARNGFTSGDKDGDGEKDTAAGDTTGDGIRATFVGGAMDYDIAVLKVEGSSYLQNSDVTEAKIGDSDTVKTGEKVFAVGNANGEGISVTSGCLSVDSENIVMSALDGRDENGDDYADGVVYRVMRTDAAINHGNSGGALFNAAGELIGITNAKNVEDETDNMGYALPITQVKYLVQNIFDNGGVVKRAMFGIVPRIASSVAEFKGGALTITEEVVVTDITSGASADGKLKYGDVIKSISVNGGAAKTITRSFQVNDLLLSVRKGDTVKVNVLRENVPVDVTIAFDKDSYFVLYK